MANTSNNEIDTVKIFLGVLALATLVAIYVKVQRVGPSALEGPGAQGGTGTNADLGTDSSGALLGHSFYIEGTPPVIQTDGGIEWVANADNFGIFEVPSYFVLANWAMSASVLSLNPLGVREPHWHPNANELNYVITGIANVTIFNGGPNQVDESFTVQAGDIFFIPKAFFHDVENLGTDAVKMVNMWDSERVQIEGISGSVGALDNRVLDATFSDKKGFFEALHRTSPQDVGITLSKTSPSKPDTGLVGSQVGNPTSKYMFHMESSRPTFNTPAGSQVKGMSPQFPILKGTGLGVSTAILHVGGIREPHWHPNAAELHFVISGKSKWAVVSPGGHVDAGEIGVGQMFFAPPGFTHYFENSSTSEDLHIALFFTSDDPQDVGFSGGMSAFSTRVLGSTFGQNPAFFNNLKRFTQDVLLTKG